MKRAFYAALGTLLGLFARVYLGTIRLTLQLDPALSVGDERPWVLCFWHGEQLPLLLWKRRRTTVALVSRSLDGEMQSRALPAFGLRVERGSTSRGGGRGLLAIVRLLREGHDAAFAIDGPRGPRFSVAPGAGVAADLASGVLVPMGSAAPRGFTLHRTWDQFRVPWPFSRVVVHLGAPLAPPTSIEELASAVARASTLALDSARVVASRRHAVLRHARRA